MVQFVVHIQQSINKRTCQVPALWSMGPLPQADLWDEDGDSSTSHSNSGSNSESDSGSSSRGVL